MMRKLSAFLIVTTLVYSPLSAQKIPESTESNRSMPPSTEAYGFPASRVAIETEWKQLIDRRNVLQAELSDLQQFRNQVILPSLDHVKGFVLNDDTASKALNDLKTAVGALKVFTPTVPNAKSENLSDKQPSIVTPTVPSSIPKPVLKSPKEVFDPATLAVVTTAMNDIGTVLGTPLVATKAPAVISILSPYVTGGRAATVPQVVQSNNNASFNVKVLTEIASVITQADIADPPTERYSVWSKLPTLMKIYNDELLPVNGNDILEKAQSEANSLTLDNIRTDFSMLISLVRSSIAKVETRVSNLVEQKGKEANVLAERIKQLDQRMVAFDIKRQDVQGQVDTILVYAVFWMIVALVILFMSLRIFPESLATRIVEERTMIELLSMGFLLTAVIILGTGRLIDGPVVGTLLGTIAGYTIGRQELKRRPGEQPPIPTLGPEPSSPERPEFATPTASVKPEARANSDSPVPPTTKHLTSDSSSIPSA